VWKPHPDAYAHAARALEADPAELVLVAVHPWDLDGASRAGWRTAYVDRSGAPWPGAFTPPDVVVGSVSGLAEALRAASG
jgi:2-haloacid dehalogenase